MGYSKTVPTAQLWTDAYSNGHDPEDNGSIEEYSEVHPIARCIERILGVSSVPVDISEKESQDKTCTGPLQSFPDENKSNTTGRGANETPPASNKDTAETVGSEKLKMLGTKELNGSEAAAEGTTAAAKRETTASTTGLFVGLVFLFMTATFAFAILIPRMSDTVEAFRVYQREKRRLHEREKEDRKEEPKRKSLQMRDARRSVDRDRKRGDNVGEEEPSKLKKKKQNADREELIHPPNRCPAADIACNLGTSRAEKLWRSQRLRSCGRGDDEAPFTKLVRITQPSDR